HFEAIINLAGASISEGRWTETRKKEIYDSRINSCRTLENYLYDGRINTDIYIGSSAIGIYGDLGSTEVTETTPIKAKDWFVKTVIDWEKAHMRIAALEIRTVIIRTGIVLSADGGAFKEIFKTSRWGVLPYFGNGRQIWSWIHLRDIAGIMFYCIDLKDLHGIFLGTAPHPVTNRKLVQAIDANIWLNLLVVGIPKFTLALILGEMHRVLFESCNAPGKKIMEAGYQFQFSTVQAAMKELIHGKKGTL
ncbi:MAG TPA: TIGR01777 family oxidoreductase, partial [Chitinophagaceae bacterium]|nr:TIGR01777 family oxidoreductase [Chitinophagaceae bacterium]